VLKVLGKKLTFVTEITEGNISQGKEVAITDEVRHLEGVKGNPFPLPPLLLPVRLLLIVRNCNQEQRRQPYHMPSTAM
jgi:hypothetical protein